MHTPPRTYADWAAIPVELRPRPVTAATAAIDAVRRAERARTVAAYRRARALAAIRRGTAAR